MSAVTEALRPPAACGLVRSAPFRAALCPGQRGPLRVSFSPRLSCPWPCSAMGPARLAHVPWAAPAAPFWWGTFFLVPEDTSRPLGASCPALRRAVLPGALVLHGVWSGDGDLGAQAPLPPGIGAAGPLSRHAGLCVSSPHACPCPVPIPCWPGAVWEEAATGRGTEGGQSRACTKVAEPTWTGPLAPRACRSTGTPSET